LADCNVFNPDRLHEENPCGLGFSAELRTKDAALKPVITVTFSTATRPARLLDTGQKYRLDSMQASVIDRKILSGMHASSLRKSYCPVLIWDENGSCLLLCLLGLGLGGQQAEASSGQGQAGRLQDR